MKVSKLARFVTLALSLAIVLTLVVGVVGAQDEEKTLVSGLNMVGGDLNTLDPSLSEVSGEHTIITLLFPGVTVQDELTAEVVSGIASSWDVSEDGLVYTYHLIPDIPWVRVNQETGEVEQVMDDSGNPLYVTANDIIYGITRTLDPETASPYSYVMAPYVLNGVEFNAGEAAAEDLGLVAVDDYTLEITLPEAVGFAPGIHGLWMAAPELQSAVEAGGDEWTEPENIATYGPFAMADWAHDEGITLVANPFWPGTDTIQQPILDRIEFRFLDPQAQFAEFQAGTIDAIDVPLEELERVQNDPELSTMYSNGTRLCTYYLGFDNTEAPVDNAHLRRALSLAVDRQSIVDNVTKGGQIPAQWFSRPGLAAAPTLDSHPDLGITFNPEEAQAELALALEELGLASAADLPALTFAYNDSSGHAAIVQAVQQMWTDNLGINVQLTAMDPTTYFATVSEEAPTIYRSGWCQDYPDANNFLFDVFHSESSQNDPGFSDPEYDALIEQARVSTDTAERTELYAQAEEILVDRDAGVIPIYWYTTNQLTRPYVERTYSIIGDQAYEVWDLDTEAQAAQRAG
jgi:oligopeptide transport system substrate-binding protein